MIKFTVVLLCLLVSVCKLDGLEIEDHAAHEIFAEELDSELAEIAQQENGLDAAEDLTYDSVALTEQQDTSEGADEANDDDDVVNESETHNDFEDGDRQSRRGERRGTKRVGRRDRRPGRHGVNENRGDRLSPASNDGNRGHRASMRERGHKGRLGRRPGVVRENEEEPSQPKVSEVVLVMEQETSNTDQPNEVMGEEESRRGPGHRGPGHRGPGRRRPDHRHGRRCRKHHRRGEGEQEPELAQSRTCIGEGCEKVPYLLPVEEEVTTQQSEVDVASTASNAWWWWSS